MKKGISDKWQKKVTVGYEISYGGSKRIMTIQNVNYGAQWDVFDNGSHFVSGKDKDELITFCEQYIKLSGLKINNS